MRRIDELTEPPVIGQFYLVPTARELWLNRLDAWPILLPFHEDAEIIGFKDDHAHLDRRFMTPRQFRYAETGFYTSERSIDGFPLSRYATDGKREGGPRPRPTVEWRRRKCYREMTPHCVHQMGNKAWFPRLEDAYANCRLKPGLVCPHRGAHLGSLPVDADGNVVCPMHGLKWNLVTGELVRNGGG